MPSLIRNLLFNVDSVICSWFLYPQISYVIIKFLCWNLFLCSDIDVDWVRFPDLNNDCSFCRASAIFVGVYEPTKQKLLQMLPENLTAVAHLVTLNSHRTLWSEYTVLYFIFLLIMFYSYSSNLLEILAALIEGCWISYRLQVLLEGLLLLLSVFQQR